MGRYCKLFGCDFLARGGTPGGAFCTGLLFSGSCGIRCRQCSSPFCRLRHSVPERASWGTEWTRGTVEGLLVYATRFQRLSVQKTGVSGTEGIFGTKNPLLRYRLTLISEERCTGSSPRPGCPKGPRLEVQSAFWAILAGVELTEGYFSDRLTRGINEKA